MTGTLSRPVRRTLAIALLILPPLAVWQLAVAPWLDHRRAQHAAVEDMHDRAARYRRIAAETPALERRLAALRQRGAATEGFVAESNETLAGAALQARLKTAIEAQGGTLSSSQILPARSENGIRRLVVRVQATQRQEQLAGMLAALAEARPALAVDAIEVRVRRGGDPAAPLLDTRLDVAAFMRPAP